VTIKHKVCLLGAAAVGKTSLMRRYVRSIFSEEYQTTVGVTIEKKRVQRRGIDVELMIWDLSGEDEFQTVRVSYLDGASGYLLVVDGTRASTLVTARALQSRVEQALGPIPFVLLLNKADLADRWEVGFAIGDPLARAARQVVRTSAKTGSGVEQAFATLVDGFLEEERDDAR
jgi:small GTP-binding protein